MSEAIMHESSGGAEPAREAPRDPNPARQHAQTTAGPPDEWVRRPVGDFDPRYKSPRSSVFLSLIFPGLGQIYTGFYMRGLLIGAVIFMLFNTAARVNDNTTPIMVWTILFTWMFSMIDAGRMAALYNYAITGGEEIEMPQDIRLPNMGGSIVAGAILIGFGGIALSNTLFDLPLDWVGDWWPVFPLALGAYLLARGVMDHLNANNPAEDHSEPMPLEQE